MTTPELFQALFFVADHPEGIHRTEPATAFDREVQQRAGIGGRS